MNPADTRTIPPSTRPTELVLNIYGLWCASCCGILEAKLREVPGVLDARVDFASAQLWLATTGTADLAAFEKCAANLGYRITELFAASDTDEIALLNKRYLQKLAVVAFFSMWSLVFSLASYFDSSTTPFALFSAGASLPAFLVGAYPFARMALLALRSGGLTFDLLVLVANSLLMVTSVHALISGEGAKYFETVGMALTVILAARYIEAQMRSNLKSEMRTLFLQSLGKTRVRSGQHWVMAAAEKISVGRTVGCLAGEEIHHDLKVKKGSAWVASANITGESRPELRVPGDSIYAGEILVSGEIEGIVLETVGGRWIDRHVFASAVNLGRMAEVRFFDRIMKYWVPSTLLFAAVVFGAKLSLGGSGWSALTTAALVMLTSCPCALALVEPMARAIEKIKLLKMGFKVHRVPSQSVSLEGAKVIFDKTGTLTVSNLGDDGIVGFGQIDLKKLKELITGASWGVFHPLSEAISKASSEEVDVAGTRSVVAGVGVRWERADGSVVEIRKPLLPQEASRSAFQSLICLNGELVGGINFEEIIAEEAFSALAQLKKAGYPLILLSGDRQRDISAKFLGLFEESKFSQRPEDKLAYVEASRLSGRAVIFIGDGFNDIQAMAASGVSFGVSSQGKWENKVCNISLSAGQLTLIPGALSVLGSMHQRRSFAYGGGILYNAATLVLLLAGFLHPLLVVLAMTSASILIMVVLSSGRLPPKGRLIGM